MPDDILDAVTGDEGAASADLPGGSDEGTSDEPRSLEEIASEIDADEIAKLEGGEEGGSPKGGVKEGGEGNPPGPDASLSAVKAFIKKEYNGDENEFIASLYETRAEQKRLAAELRAEREGKSEVSESVLLEQRVTQFQALRDNSPDVQAIDQDIQDIDRQDQQVRTDQGHLLTRAEQISTKINSLQADYAKAEPEDKSDIRATIAEHRAELGAIDAKWQSNEGKIKGFALSRKSLLRDLNRAEREIERSMSEEEDAARRAESENARTVRAFNGSFNAFAGGYAVDPNSPRGKTLKENVKLHLANYLETKVGKREGLDAAAIYEATGKLVAHHAEMMGIRTKIPSKSNGESNRAPAPRPVLHRPSSPSPSPRPGSRSSSTIDDVLSDPDKVRARAERIFTAQAQRGAGGGRRRSF